MYIDERSKILKAYGLTTFADLNDEFKRNTLLDDERRREVLNLIINSKVIDKTCEYANYLIKSDEIQEVNSKKYYKYYRMIKSIKIQHKIKNNKNDFNELILIYKPKNRIFFKSRFKDKKAIYVLAEVIKDIKEYNLVLEMVYAPRYRIELLNNLAMMLQDIIDLMQMFGSINMDEINHYELN